MSTRSIVLLAALATLLPAARASADDEGSEHTAALFGDKADTLGVILRWDDHDGWTASIRDKATGDEHVYTLGLPKEHAHYAAYVTAGRKAVVFVELSRGTAPRAADRIAWEWGADGKLLRSWTYEQVLTVAELRAPQRSAGHVTWDEGVEATSRGLELKVFGTGRKVVLARDGSTLR